MAASSIAVSKLTKTNHIDDFLNGFVIPSGFNDKYHTGNKYLTGSGAKKFAYIRNKLEAALGENKVTTNEGHIELNDYDQGFYRELIRLIDDFIIHEDGNACEVYFSQKNGPIASITTKPALYAFKMFLDVFKLFNISDMSKKIKAKNFIFSIFFRENIVDKSIKNIASSLDVYVGLFDLAEDLSRYCTLFDESTKLYSRMKKITRQDKLKAYLPVFQSILERVIHMPIVSIYRLSFDEILKSKKIASGQITVSRQMLHVLKKLHEIAVFGGNEFENLLQKTADDIYIRWSEKPPEQSSFNKQLDDFNRGLAESILSYKKQQHNIKKLEILTELQKSILAMPTKAAISEKLNSLLFFVSRAYRANLCVLNDKGQLLLPGRTGDIITQLYSKILMIFSTLRLADDKKTETLVDMLRAPSIPRLGITSR